MQDPGDKFDADRFEFLAKDAIAWCLEQPPDVSLFASCLDLPDLVVRLDELPWNALTRLPPGWWVGLTSLSTTAYRQMYLHTFPKGGRGVSVVVGSAAENYDWVEPARDSIRTFLIDHAATTYYSRMNTRYDDNSSPDIHDPSRIFPRNMPAFEDRRLGDVFGVQVLSPDFPCPMPHPDWTQTRLPEGRLLLEHNQPERWFGPQDPFSEPSRPRWPVPEFPGPELVADSRTHFAELCIPQRADSISWSLVAKAERILGRAPGYDDEFSITLADGRIEHQVAVTSSEGQIGRRTTVGPPLDVDATQVVDLVRIPPT
jgi:hypothetical protein